MCTHPPAIKTFQVFIPVTSPGCFGDVIDPHDCELDGAVRLTICKVLNNGIVLVFIFDGHGTYLVC